MKLPMKILFILLGLLVVATSNGNAQGPSYDLTRSIKNYAFKGTHNSYDVGEVGTLSLQLDGHNVWAIEIDMCGIDDDGRLQVKHGAEPGSSLLFRNIMDDVRQTVTFQKRQRVLFIWLDVKEQVGTECRWRHLSDNDRTNVMQEEMVTFLAAGDTSIFYTNTDWKADGRTWPSIQELLNREPRGKYFIPIYDNNDHSPDHPFFFVTAQSLEEANGKDWVAFINKEDADLEDDAIFPNDQYLWRSYDVNSRDEWVRGSQLGFNILSTDEVAADWTFTFNTHPPVPVFVDERAPLCGRFLCRLEHGTYLNPFGPARLRHAIGVAADHTGVVLAPGAYPLDKILTINKPMVIEVGQTGYPSSSGPAIIGQ